MTTIRSLQADITDLDVDAIVNAANVDLVHAGGIAAAIARAGGAIVDEESRAWVREHGPLSPGTAAVTSAGDMPSRHVIHVAGPIHRPDHDNAGLLASAVTAALDAAAHLGARTIAMPAISAGIYGYPRAEATAMITAVAREWAGHHPGALDQILLVGYDAAAAADFAAALEQTA